jgi:hypothetical protein
MRLVISRHQADLAGRASLVAGLHALGAASAAGAEKAAKELTSLLADLDWLAGAEPDRPDPAGFESQLAGLFGAIGVEGGEN